jgi:hypothetical protein
VELLAARQQRPAFPLKVTKESVRQPDRNAASLRAILALWSQGNVRLRVRHGSISPLGLRPGSGLSAKQSCFRLGHGALGSWVSQLKRLSYLWLLN